MFSKMCQLKKGWNGYDAQPPNSVAINAAKEFLLHSPEPQRVAPSVVGGVGITFRKAVKEVYVEFYNDGKIFYMLTEDNKDPVIEPFAIDCMEKIITHLDGKL